MLTRIIFNAPASTLFKGRDNKLRFKIEDKIAYLKPSHRPHVVKDEWLGKIQFDNGLAVAAFEGKIMVDGFYQLIKTSYGWYILLESSPNNDFGCQVALQGDAQ